MSIAGTQGTCARCGHSALVHLAGCQARGCVCPLYVTVIELAQEKLLEAKRRWNFTPDAGKES